MSSFEELAARCEAATGTWYDHALDADIYEALGYSVLRERKSPSGRGWMHRGHGPLGFGSHWCGNRALTYKLDDALTLVPEGALWKIDRGMTWSDDRAANGQRTDYRAGVGIGDVPATWTEGRSFTSPALALSAAALRARAASRQQDKSLMEGV